MADTHQEQLLSELLSTIARDDERLEAAHLELCVMARLDAAPAPRLRASTIQVVIAAAVLMAVLVPGVAWVVRDVPTAVGEAQVEPRQQATVNTSTAITKPSIDAPPTKRPALSRSTTPVKAAPPARAALSERPMTQSAIAQSAITQPPIPQAPDAFVPLMPMTEQELMGSFQLVRVQMPRASLGALRSPFDSPNELIEADVLLGEDGMARAIRVSTSGSIYPWRSR